METINGFLFMPERWSSNYFENVDVEKDLKRHLTTVPGESITIKRTKVRSYNNPDGTSDWEGYVWYTDSKSGSPSVVPYGFDRNYYAEKLARAPALFKGRLFFEMDRDTFNRWKQTTYMSQIKNISLIDEEGNDLKAPGIVYPADCPFKDPQ